MNQEQFIKRIEEDPSNTNLRRVYADWLEERGLDEEAEVQRLWPRRVFHPSPGCPVDVDCFHFRTRRLGRIVQVLEDRPGHRLVKCWVKADSGSLLVPIPFLQSEPVERSWIACWPFLLYGMPFVWEDWNSIWLDAVDGPSPQNYIPVNFSRFFRLPPPGDVDGGVE